MILINIKVLKGGFLGLRTRASLHRSCSKSVMRSVQ
jgi:hypothetical protein